MPVATTPFYHKILNVLASPAIVFFVLPWLMLLLVIGTLAQHEMGLYQAEQRYFASAIIWLFDGIVPIPGTPIALGLLGISLLAKLLLKSPWNRRNAGIIIAHLGVFLLLLGGLITALTSEEGFIVLPEGGSSAQISDYHARELILLKNANIIARFPIDSLEIGASLHKEGVPFTAIITDYCENCMPQFRTDAEMASAPSSDATPRGTSTSLRGTSTSLRGLAETLLLSPIPLSRVEEENYAGITLHISGLGNAQDGEYIAYEPMPRYPEFSAGDDHYKIVLRKSARTLPFTVILKDFIKSRHPGSDMAREYASHVTISDPPLTWDATISMNEPLRHKGYTLYQSSYLQIDGQEYSVLAVVKNTGRSFPYIASGVLCIGLLLHLFMRRTSATATPTKTPTKNMKHWLYCALLLVMLGIFGSASAIANDAPDTAPSSPITSPSGAQSRTMQHFAQIPVAHEGRIKPLQAAAQAYLSIFSEGHLGSTNLFLDHAPATTWLAAVFFDHHTAQSIAIMYVDDPQLMHFFHLPERDNHLYSPAELSAAYRQQAKAIEQLEGELKTADGSATGSATPRTEQHALLKALTALHDRVKRYYALTHSFSLITHPISLENVQLSGLSAETIAHAKTGEYATYLTLHPMRQAIQDALDAILPATHTAAKPPAFSEAELSLLKLATTLAWLEEAGNTATELKLLPGGMLAAPMMPQGNDVAWIAPWEILTQSAGSPATAELLALWHDLADAYRHQNADAWEALSAQLVTRTTTVGKVSTWQLSLEQLYLQLPLIHVLTLLYLAMALMCLIIIPLAPHAKPLHRIQRSIGYGVWVAIGLHCLLLGMRIAILGRAPVGTLYESILFVSLVAVLFGWALDRRKQRKTDANTPASTLDAMEGTGIGTLIAGLLLGISGYYAPEGDSLGVLVAVLNTQFWLLVHVLCITAGYGAALVAGLLSHLYLWHYPATLSMAGATHPAFKRLHMAALVALLLTALGTLLGGIWADQSWGRFWGWDPKENGAMLIVLWLIWVLHGRLSSHLRPRAFTALLALINIIVALSWFGVNLLGVGLHSYGFTDSAAFGLAAFCGVELALVVWLYMRARHSKAI